MEYNKDGKVSLLTINLQDGFAVPDDDDVIVPEDHDF